MHNSLKHQPMPAALMPFVPPVRKGVSGVRFELGQIAPEPVPARAYRPEPTIFFDPTAEVVPRHTPWRPRHERVPKECRDCTRGPGCGRTFLPRQPASVRCSLCRHLRWHAPRRRQAA